MAQPSCVSPPGRNDGRHYLQKLEDSRIQGRSRLCKVIRSKIDLQQKNNINGVCKVGLYGMSGVGKTTVCKALCNEFVTKFCGRVCHAELERVSKEELLRDVLKRLSNTSHERLNRCSLEVMLNGLKEGKFIQEAVFLALDNMTDTNTSLLEVNSYLSAGLPPGSIVMVTARSKESFALLRTSVKNPRTKSGPRRANHVHIQSYIDEDESMKMPELEMEEARSLFVKSSENRNEDEHLIQRCLERCRFWRDVLGRELGRFNDPKEWGAQLDMIDNAISNQSQEKDYHPIFPILRKSFDTLSGEDQLLYMDVALFLPRQESHFRPNVFEWLGVLHGIPRIDDVMKRMSGFELHARHCCGISMHLSFQVGKVEETIAVGEVW